MPPLPLSLTLLFVHLFQQLHGSTSYIVDTWGSISLPFSTKYCQNSLPVDSYTTYTCSEQDSDPVIIKEVQDTGCLNGRGAPTYNVTINSNNSYTNDCTNDLSNPSEEFSPLLGDSGVIAMYTNCLFEPPARRYLYLSKDRCFLLSNTTISYNGTTSKQELYAMLTCNYDATEDNVDFLTKLYVNNECTSSTPDIERNLPWNDCSEWLFQNETGFDFLIFARV